SSLGCHGDSAGRNGGSGSSSTGRACPTAPAVPLGPASTAGVARERRARGCAGAEVPESSAWDRLIGRFAITQISVRRPCAPTPPALKTAGQHPSSRCLYTYQFNRQ